MPQRKIPWFACRSASLRARISSIDSPASVPMRVQQKARGMPSFSSTVATAIGTPAPAETSWVGGGNTESMAIVAGPLILDACCQAMPQVLNVWTIQHRTAYYRIMDAAASELGAFMRARGLTQAELAQAAEVSQATVSRALHEPTVRTGRARARLFNYIHQNRPKVPDVAMTAIVATWDGTDAHAQALAELILVSGRLWPKLGKE